METMLLRHVLHGRVVAAFPSTVVERNDSRVVAWIAPGTPIIYPRGRDADDRLVPFDRWGVEQRRWEGPGGLELTEFGRRYSIRHFRRNDGSFRGWYVNLQAAVTESRFGFDTTDWQLDLWIEPGENVRWKDEDDLAQALDLGLMTAEEGRLAREEAHRVIDEWPFPTGFEVWQPDPAWAAPALPEDWHVV